MWGGNEDYAAFSLDGKIAVSRDMVLWDVETIQPLGEALAGEEEWFTNMVFSPDGNQIASINGKRDAIILWNLNPQSWVDLTCQRVGRNLTRTEWTQYFPNEEYRLTCPQWPAEE